MKKNSVSLTLFVCLLTLIFFTASFSTPVSADSASSSVSSAAQKSITDCTVNISVASNVYDGTTKKLSVTVKNGTETLKKNVDYTCSRSTVKNAGTYTVTVSGKGNYYGQVKKKLTIKQKDISKCIVQKDYTFNGQSGDYIPEIKVSSSTGAYALKNGTDFDFTRTSGTKSTGTVLDAGDYSYTITGKGNFCGSVSSVLTVNQKDISSCYIQKNYEYTGKGGDFVPVIRESSSPQSASLVCGTDFQFQRKTGPFYLNAVMTPGNYTYTISGTGNYCGEINTTITVDPKKINASDIDVVPYSKMGFLDKTTGKVRNAVGVFIKFNDSTIHLTNGTDYTVDYTDKNGKVQATVTLCHYFEGTSNTIDIPDSQPAFIWGQDNFQFTNGYNKTGVGYKVSEEIIQKISSKLKLTEREKNIIRDYSNTTRSFKGRCNGMASATILSKMGLLNFSEVSSHFSDIAYENEPVDSLIYYINFLQASLRIDYYKLETIGYSFVDERSNQGMYIKKILNELENNDSMIKLCLDKEDSAHVVVAYAAEPCNYHSDVTGKDYNYKILLYNSNSSADPSILYHESCIYVYKPDSGYDWDYRYYISSAQYWNCSWDYPSKWVGITSAVKYLSLTDQKDILHDKTLIIGDANMDGVVNVKDVTFIQRYVAELITIDDPIQRIAADANHDGIISIQDATYLSLKLAEFDVD